VLTDRYAVSDKTLVFYKVQYMFKKICICGVLVLSFSMLGGCATEVAKEVNTEGQPSGPDQAVEPGAEGTASSTSITPLGKDRDLQLDALHDPQSPLSTRVIYFDFDSHQVSAEGVGIINAHGRFLANHPNQRLRLEGHTDERGSREYNLGLGEQRAQAVSQLLKLQGVGADQIELISYGEELPATFGHDEESWQLNRRVELVYIDQQ
jgi:peptidoglycan-associated lipoprotein